MHDHEEKKIQRCMQLQVLLLNNDRELVNVVVRSIDVHSEAHVYSLRVGQVCWRLSALDADASRRLQPLAHRQHTALAI